MLRFCYVWLERRSSTTTPQRKLSTLNTKHCEELSANQNAALWGQFLARHLSLDPGPFSGHRCVRVACDIVNVIPTTKGHSRFVCCVGDVRRRWLLELSRNFLPPS